MTADLICQARESGASLRRLLRVAWSLAIAAHDLNLICLHRLTRVLHLERNVLDQECPYLVAETVGIEMALYEKDISPSSSFGSPTASVGSMYLERQPRLHLIC